VSDRGGAIVRIGVDGHRPSTFFDCVSKLTQREKLYEKITFEDSILVNVVCRRRVRDTGAATQFQAAGVAGHTPSEGLLSEIHI
jgi:hypothetical protein